MKKSIWTNLNDNFQLTFMVIAAVAIMAGLLGGCASPEPWQEVSAECVPGPVRTRSDGSTATQMIASVPVNDPPSDLFAQVCWTEHDPHCNTYARYQVKVEGAIATAGCGTEFRKADGELIDYAADFAIFKSDGAE